MWSDSLMLTPIVSIWILFFEFKIKSLGAYSTYHTKVKMNKATSHYIYKIELIIYLKRNKLPQIYYGKNMGGYIAPSSMLKLVAVELRMRLLPIYGGFSTGYKDYM